MLAERTGSGISISYVKTIPAGIASQLTDNAKNGKNSNLSTLGSKLSSFHDDQILHGFDAMINIGKYNGNAVLTLMPLEGKMVTEVVMLINFQSLYLGSCNILFAVDNYFPP